LNVEIIEKLNNVDLFCSLPSTERKISNNCINLDFEKLAEGRAMISSGVFAELYGNMGDPRMN
jgi:hypothetical protein